MEVVGQQDSVFKLDALELVHDARSSNGTRHDDYQRYRKYCARRIAKLRKFTSLQQGRRTFEKRTINKDLVTSDSVIELLLFETERKWAYAMELKLTQEPRKLQHAKRLLSRAKQAAEALEANFKGSNASMIIVQAYAGSMRGYYFFEKREWRPALECFERAKRAYEQMASNAATKRESIYQAAADNLDANIRYCTYRLQLTSESKTQDLSSMTQLRKLQQQNDMGSSVPQMENLLAQMMQSRAKSVHFVLWRGSKIPVRSPELAQALIEVIAAWRAQDSMDLRLEGIDQFDDILTSCGEGVKCAEKQKKAALAAAAEVKSSKSTENHENLEQILGLMTLMLTQKRIERDLLLIEHMSSQLPQGDSGAPPIRSDLISMHRPSKTASALPAANSLDNSTGGKKKVTPELIIKLFDSILKQYGDMQDIPALKGMTDYQALTEALKAVLHLQRCLFVMGVYTQNGQSKQAYCLCKRAKEHVTTARLKIDSTLRCIRQLDSRASQNMSAESSEELEAPLERPIVTAERLASLVTSLDSLVRSWSVYHQVILYSQYKAGKDVDDLASDMESMDFECQNLDVNRKVPLVDSLDKFRFSFASVPLVHFPPRLEPVPAKPILFDIALKYCDAFE